MMRLLEMDSCRTCAYLADTAAFPYGEKSQDEVTERALFTCGSAIKAFDPRVVVVACNTMSVAALCALRERFARPIVGTVPAIRLAAETTKNKRIGFLATDATVAASYSNELTRCYASSCKVFPLGAPELVDFVEKRITDATEEEKEDAVLPAAKYFAERGCDTIILGCTHFTHLSDAMAKAASALIPDVAIVDSRDGVARQSLKVLRSLPTLHSTGGFDTQYAAQPPCTQHSTLIYDKCVFVTGEDSVTWQKLCAAHSLKWMGHLH